MTRVDFYILQQVTDLNERARFACRLVHKAYKQGYSVYVNTNDEQHCEQVDQLLWCEPVTGFIPHSRADRGHTSVNIGYATLPGEHSQVLVNIADSVPDFFSRFERIAEIVIFEPRIQELTRANYKFYKDRGLPLNSHTIS